MRKTPLRRSRKPLKRSRIKPRARSRAEKERIYGTPDRIAFLKAQGCLLCDEQPVQLHHVRTGGMGKKSGAENQVPLCVTHHEGVHRFGRKTMEAAYSVDFARSAQEYDEAFRAFTGAAS